MARRNPLAVLARPRPAPAAHHKARPPRAAMTRAGGRRGRPTPEAVRPGLAPWPIGRLVRERPGTGDRTGRGDARARPLDVDREVLPHRGPGLGTLRRHRAARSDPVPIRADDPGARSRRRKCLATPHRLDSNASWD